MNALQKGCGMRIKREYREKEKERKKCPGWKGSYTVEAALIFGMTFFVLAALLIVTFYMHDRAVMQAITCEAASAGSNFYRAEDRSDAAGRIQKQMKAGRLFGSKNLSGTAAVGSRESVSFWNASYPVPGLVMRYLTDNSLPIRTEWTSRILDPADTIRKIRGAGKILTGGEP